MLQGDAGRLEDPTRNGLRRPGIFVANGCP